ncbi:MAG: manganese efflux pump MntP family protein [Peptococcaceae bacterium]
MNIYTIFAVAFALGIDAFSLSIGIGLSGVRRSQIYLVSTVVAVFHIFMPLIGLYLGQVLGKFVGPIASILGAVVLIVIGIHTLWENFKPPAGTRNFSSGGFDAIAVSHPVSLMLMAASVSLDALTVGLGLGVINADLTLTVITMGIVAGIMTFGGLIFGKKLSKSVGEKAELLSGFILIAIGLKLLFM